MQDPERLLEGFQLQYEKFIAGCDSIEIAEAWDKDANGEMETFYINEIISVILSLIISDGEIDEAEVRYLNEAFGFQYDAETLRDVYRNAGEEISSYFETSFRDSYRMLRDINEKLADAYEELFRLICEIIVDSDGVVTDEEKKMIAGLTLR